MGTTPEKNLQTLTFLLAEIGVIMIKAIHIVLRYAIHLYDLNHTGLWEHKGRYVSHFYHVTFYLNRRLIGCADLILRVVFPEFHSYESIGAIQCCRKSRLFYRELKFLSARWLHYNDLVLGCSFLTLNLFHHLHMLLSGNLWLSMASLVICMHIRFLFNEIQKQYHRHLNYRRVVIDMECKYPTVNKKGECAICWDTFRWVIEVEMSHLYESYLVLPVNYLVAIAFMEAVYVYGLNKMQRVQHVGGN